MTVLAWTSARGRRRTLIRSIALLSGLMIMVGSSIAVDAATTTKAYAAVWVTGSGTASSIGIARGATTVTLRLTNQADPQSLGSANISPPSGYTLTGAGVVGNVLQLRNLNLASGASVDVPISVTTPCLTGGPAQAWTLVVKQANNFSGPPGNNFIPAGPAPSTAVTGTATCLLRFADQPGTTQTGQLIRSGFDSTGASISVEIYDPTTGLTVDSSASVTLAQVPDQGTLTGATETASAGVATFSTLSLDLAGRYVLRASSPAAGNTPNSDAFMVADTIEECTSADCSFEQTLDESSYTTTPNRIKAGATFVSSLNLPGLVISCAGAPYNYPDSRQPNTVWYEYDDGGTSAKTNLIVIDKLTVQQTPENGASAYRVCYSSPDRFTDRLGNPAPEDQAVTDYFGGTTTWYTGLLPDCGNKKKPQLPCVVNWTGDSGGARLGTFLTPPGDPVYR